MTLQSSHDACVECHRVCTETVTYCLETGGELGRSANVRVLLDCAQVCHTSADILLRMSDLQDMTCRVCADICDRCAAICDQFPEDAQMVACAEACRACVEACRDMVGAIAA